MSEILKSTKDFTAQQAPELMKEILHYKLAGNALEIIIGLIIGLIAYRVHVWILNRLKEESYSEAVMLYFGVVPTAIVSFICILDGIYDFMQILLAPRMFLIEYFAHLVRSK